MNPDLTIGAISFRPSGPSTYNESMPRTYSLARLMLGITAFCVLCGLVVNYPYNVFSELVGAILFVPTILTWRVLTSLSRYRRCITLACLIGTIFVTPFVMGLHVTLGVFFNLAAKSHLLATLFAAGIPAFCTYLAGGLFLTVEILIRWFKAAFDLATRYWRPTTINQEVRLTASSPRTSSLSSIFIATLLYYLACRLLPIEFTILASLFWRAAMFAPPILICIAAARSSRSPLLVGALCALGVLGGCLLVPEINVMLNFEDWSTLLLYLILAATPPSLCAAAIGGICIYVDHQARPT
jgi:hypothetical protein